MRKAGPGERSTYRLLQMEWMGAPAVLMLWR